MDRRTRPVRSGACLLVLALAAASADAQLRFPGPEFRVGTQASTLAVVDFDGDSALDGITIDREAGTWNVLRGNGDGTFDPPEAWPIGLNPSALAVADLDGDQVLDLVGTLWGSDEIVVRLGDGDGGLFDPIVTAAGDGAFGIRVADLDGDGVLDLVTSNLVTRTMSAFLGNGDGTFQAPVEFGFGPYPNVLSSLTVSARTFDLVDLDGDGRLDLVVGTWPIGVSVFMGNGDGTFQDPIRELDDDRDSDVTTVADMNGDDVPDLLTLGAGLADVLRVFLGDGDGTFGPPVSYPAGETPRGMVVADFDADGNRDLAVFSTTSEDVRTWLGNGEGTLTLSPQGAVPATEVSASMTAADLDGNGALDLVSALGSGYVGVRFGNGDGTFQVRDTADLGERPQMVLAADLNGDGAPDAVTPNDRSFDVSVVLGDGDGGFGPSVDYPLTVPPYSDFFEPPHLALGDLDGDEILDIVVASRAVPETNVLLGSGDGSFQQAVPIDAGPYPATVVLGDFDGDEILDVATATPLYTEDTWGITLAFGNGDGTFQPSWLLPMPGRPVYLATVDVDGDGALDLVSVDQWFESSLTVIRGNGDGSFHEPISVATVDWPVFVVATELNGDEVPDLVATHFSYSDSESDDDIVVHLGRGDGTFEALEPIAAGRWASHVAPADIDGDGILDLTVANVIDDNVSVHRGRGDGTFGLPQFYSGGNAPFGLAVADVNGDERLDILTANAQTDSLSILLNRGEPRGRLCDVDGNGHIDRLDLREILRSRRERVEPGDPRDADGNGRVDGRDLRRCMRACDLPRCEVVTGCGMLGVEPALVLLWLGWRRRQRR